MELINALNWRYATKKMNGTPVTEDKVQQIVDAAHLAPSSSGTQPYKIFVISNPEVKAKMQPIAYGQSQIIDASHILVFAAWDKYTDERIDSMFDYTNTQRNLPLSTTDEYKIGLKSLLFSMTEEQQAAHTAKQSYLAFGTAIAAAAMLKVDATPMEGFVHQQMDELLGLDKLGLKSTVILPLGYRSESEDWLVNLPKVRRAKEDFIVAVK